MAAGSPHEPGWPSLPAAAVRRRVPTGPSGPVPSARQASQGRGPGWGAAWPPPAGAQRRGAPRSERPHPAPRAASAAVSECHGASTPRGDPEEAAARLGDQLLRSEMNGRPTAARAPRPAPAPRSPARRLPAPRNPPLGGHLGCTLQSVPRSWPKLCQGRRAGLRPGGTAAAPAEPPARPGVCGAARPGRGARSGQPSRGAARAGRVRPAPPGRATEGAGTRRGAGSQVTPGTEPRVPPQPPELVPLPGSRGRRGARRVHTHLPLRGPRAARRAGGCERAPRTAAAAGARPARSALRRGGAVLIPDRRPARAAQRSAPPGRGGEGRKATSTRFPGRAARAKSSPNKLPAAGWVLRRAAGSAPRHRRRLQLQTLLPPRPPPPLFLSTALPRCLFQGDPP